MRDLERDMGKRSHDHRMISQLKLVLLRKLAASSFE